MLEADKRIGARAIIVLSVILFTTSLSASGQGDDAGKKLLATARCASVTLDFQWNKGRPLNSDAAFVRLNRLLGKTDLDKRFFPCPAAKADILIKLQEDRVIIDSETMSLTVYEPENNQVIFTESRPLVAEENDVNRLVAHFLRAVDEQKELLLSEVQKQVSERAKLERQQHLEAIFTEDKTWELKTDPPPTANVTPPTFTLWVRGDHLYESSLKNIGSYSYATQCDSIEDAAPSQLPPFPLSQILYAGSCQYTFKWVDPNRGANAECSVSTTEIITVLDTSTPRVSGWSQRVDYSPLKQTPASCPVPGLGWVTFTATLSQ